MSKITNLETVVNEQEKEVWILTARDKKTKQIVNFVCKDGPATNEVVAQLKEKGLTFITLTTENRIRSFLSGNPVKAWAANLSALNRRGIDVEGLYDEVLHYLDRSTETERWSDAYGRPVNWIPITELDTCQDEVG